MEIPCEKQNKDVLISDVTFVKVTKTRFFIQKSLAKKSAGLTALNRKVTQTPQCRPLGPWQKNLLGFRHLSESLRIIHITTLL